MMGLRDNHNQKEAERVAEYRAALYIVETSCIYGELKEEMLRDLDRLVIGIRNSTLKVEHLIGPQKRDLLSPN